LRILGIAQLLVGALVFLTLALGELLSTLVFVILALPFIASILLGQRAGRVRAYVLTWLYLVASLLFVVAVFSLDRNLTRFWFLSIPHLTAIGWLAWWLFPVRTFFSHRAMVHAEPLMRSAASTIGLIVLMVLGWLIMIALLLRGTDWGLG
jgi:hypothetical protein